MTIFSSKKPPNNNKDLSSNSTNQQQQQQASTSNISRTRLSRDDDNSPNHPTNSNEESNLVCDNNLPSSSSTTNTILTTTTAPTSKRKSHFHHQTTVKQARRRGGSVGEKLITNSSVTNVPSNSPSSSLPMENNLSSTSNANEHLSVPSTSTSALTTVNSDEQCNSEDEYEQTTLKYDRNNLNEVSERLLMIGCESCLLCLVGNAFCSSVEREKRFCDQTNSRRWRLFISCSVYVNAEYIDRLCILVFLLQRIKFLVMKKCMQLSDKTVWIIL